VRPYLTNAVTTGTDRRNAAQIFGAHSAHRDHLRGSVTCIASKHCCPHETRPAEVISMGAVGTKDLRQPFRAIILSSAIGE